MARIITFLVFGGLGCMLLFVGIREGLRQRRLLRDPMRVDATIIRSEVHRSVSADTDPRLDRNTSTTSYRPEVRFRYEVQGRSYESDLLRPNVIVQGSMSAETAARELLAFPLHAKVQAYVDRSRHDQAFLVAEATQGPMVFTVLGLVLPPLAWVVGGWL